MLTCRSIADVLTSTKAKTETSSSPVGHDKDSARTLDSKEDTTMVGSDASNNCEANSSAKESDPKQNKASEPESCYAKAKQDEPTQSKAEQSMA